MKNDEIEIQSSSGNPYNAVTVKINEAVKALNKIGYKVNKEHKMTREEAIRKCLNGLAMKPIELGDIKASQLVDMLETLGLLKFEEKKVVNIAGIENNGDIANNFYLYGNNILDKYGTIRLEEWPEGLVLLVGEDLVLLVGGEIVWKSWEKYYKKGDKVQLHDNFGGFISGIIKE